jgi:REP element-mobilizing transposase RayT
MVGRYNPESHHRRSIRLKGYDYSKEGAYFVTMCARERECLFGEVVNGEMVMNEAGARVQVVWDELPHHYPHVRLDAFAIMPNHVHGIVMLTTVGARFIAPSSTIAPNPVPTVGEIVRGFKARCTHAINQMSNISGIRVWQRNYYEHIIRGEVDYNRIAEYISTNPQQWMSDTLHPDNTAIAPCHNVGARFIAPNSTIAPCDNVRAQFIAPDANGGIKTGNTKKGAINRAPTKIATHPGGRHE